MNESKANGKSRLHLMTEPGVINKSMIIDAYLSDDYKGEESRLHRMEPIIFENITTLHLNYKNILRIDHLWILPNLTKLSLNCNRIEIIENLEILINLKELDLSFNYIEKISNLDKLVNLEILQLFNNLITKIENLDKLENLMIFGIGNNMIDSTDGIERLRFLTQLKVLNLEGNPICMTINMVDYVAAILPNVKYYNYTYIKDDNRKRALDMFYRELRNIEANEEIELTERTKLAKQKENAQLSPNSFVEHLSEHQLFKSMCSKTEKNNYTFMLVGSRAQHIIDEYRNDVFNVTQRIYKLGLLCAGERQIEIADLTNNLERDHLDFQEMSKQILDEFITIKNDMFEKAVKKENNEQTDINESMVNLTDIFNEKVNNVWQNLMRLELHLHEATEEIIATFECNIQKMITSLVEEAQLYFSELRDLVNHFTENAYDILAFHMATLLPLDAVKNGNVDKELKHCIENEEAIKNVIAGMKEFHIQQINNYEDQLILRSRKFIVDMMDKLKDDELKRNRAKVVEINTFLDEQYLQNSILL